MNFLEKTMKTQCVELTAGGRSLAEAKIQGGIFQIWKWQLYQLWLVLLVQWVKDY